MKTLKQSCVLAVALSALLCVTGCPAPPSAAMVSSVAETCKSKGMVTRVFVGGTVIVECVRVE